MQISMKGVMGLNSQVIMDPKKQLYAQKQIQHLRAAITIVM